MTKHPVQTSDIVRFPYIPESVALKAYEVYKFLYGEQPAMINVEHGCRGGFSVREIIAFLYASSFPKNQWREQFEKALEK